MGKLIEFGAQGGAISKVCLQIPNKDEFDLDFARNSLASTRQADGTIIANHGIDLPRIDFEEGDDCPSLLLEEETENLFLNTETLSAQNVTLENNTWYTISYYGTGVLFLTNAHTRIMTGIGVNDRLTVTFLSTSTLLEVAVAGVVAKAQLEEKEYVTSYIESTGVTGVRERETVKKEGWGDFLKGDQGTFYVKWKPINVRNTPSSISLSNGDFNNSITVGFFAGDSKLSYMVTVDGVTQTSNDYLELDLKEYINIAITWKKNEFKCFVNGYERYLDLSGITFEPRVLNRFALDTVISNSTAYGRFKEFEIHDRVLSDAELGKRTENGSLNPVFAINVVTQTPNETITIPTDGNLLYNYYYKTDDGQIGFGNTGDADITFSRTGNYEIYITGIFPKILFTNGVYKNIITRVLNWGDYGKNHTNQDFAFFGCSNLISIANDVQYINEIVSAIVMFTNCALRILPPQLTLEKLENGTSMLENNQLIDLPTMLAFENLKLGSNILGSMRINTPRYSQLLVDMLVKNTNNNVPFGGGLSQYNTVGEIARDQLIASPRLWTITDGGLETI